MERKNLWGLLGGLFLILLGVIFLAGELFSFNAWGYIWPFFIIGVGVAFFAAMFAMGRDGGAFAIPGSIFLTIGLILFVQNLFNLWATWAYAWALIIAAVGVGLLIFGRRSDIPTLQQAGVVVTGVGLFIFFAFGLIFEIGASLFGFRNLTGFIFPVLLILVGLMILFGRVVQGPVERTVIDLPLAFQAVPASSGGVDSGEALPVEGSSEPVGAIRRVEFHSIGDITIRQGEREELVIEANEAIKSRIKTEMRGDTLRISYQTRWMDFVGIPFWGGSPIRYDLMVRTLESLQAGGVGNITIPELVTGQLEVNQSGTGSLTIQSLEADRLNASLSGVGSMKVKGRVNHQEAYVTGTGSYQADRLTSQSAVVKLSGVGSATIWVEEELDATVTGTGSISYYGNPKVNQRISGVGNIQHAGMR